MKSLGLEFAGSPIDVDPCHNPGREQIAQIVRKHYRFTSIRLGRHLHTSIPPRPHVHPPRSHVHPPVRVKVEVGVKIRVRVKVRLRLGLRLGLGLGQLLLALCSWAET